MTPHSMTFAHYEKPLKALKPGTNEDGFLCLKMVYIHKLFFVVVNKQAISR